MFRYIFSIGYEVIFREHFRENYLFSSIKNKLPDPQNQKISFVLAAACFTFKYSSKAQTSRMEQNISFCSTPYLRPILFYSLYLKEKINKCLSTLKNIFIIVTETFVVFIYVIAKCCIIASFILINVIYIYKGITVESQIVEIE